MQPKCGEKLSCKKGIKGCFARNLYVILAFLIPVLVAGIIFALRRYYPFGNRMIMVVDAWHQYYPFLVEYQRMLKEGASVLYSWNTGGGVNFLGVIANYVGSPLYMLSYFVPDGTPWLQAFLCLTVVLRMGVAGMSTAVFLRKLFGRNDLSLVAFGTAYAFCGFFMGYYWNMMWLDTVALMPLVIAGVVGVLRDRQFSLYIISLALSVMFSFYMGYMVCLFVLHVAVCYTIVSFVSMKHSLANAGRMLIYTGIAFMITAAVTVPAFMALQNSDSSAEVSAFPLEYTINYGYGYNDNSLLHTLWAIARTATNMLSYTKPIKMDQGLPNIACGVLSLVLLVFYIASRKIKIKEKIVSGSLLVFFILSFVVNQLNYIWHGMNTPAMVYYRWSYIFSFAVIILAYRAFVLIDFVTKKNFIISSALLAVYLGAAFFLQSKKSVVITAAAAFAVLVGIMLYRKKKLSYKLVCIMLCLLTVCESGLTFYYSLATVGYSENDDYPQNYDEVMELVELTDSDSSEELYRTEFLKPYTLNDGALYSLYGISTFNSMCDSSYGDFFAEMGLAGSKGNNRYVYLETTPVANLLLSVRYIITRDGQEIRDTEYTREVASTDECALYENTAFVPSGYMADTALLDYKLHDKTYIPVDAQNDLFSYATGIDEEVLQMIAPTAELSFENKELVEKSEDYEWFYNIDLKENPIETSTDDELSPAYVEYTVPEDGVYYAMFFGSQNKKSEIYINGEDEPSVVHDQTYAYLGALGRLSAGDTLKAEIGVKNHKNNVLTTHLVKLNEEVFEEGVERLRRSTMTLIERTDRGLKGEIQAENAGLFTTSVLYTEGFEAYVDGKEVEITPVGDTFIAFEISEGSHKIELKFTPPGLYAGIFISVAGICAFVLTALVIRARRKKEALSSESDTMQETDTDTATEDEQESDSSETDANEDV